MATYSLLPQSVADSDSSAGEEDPEPSIALQPPEPIIANGKPLHVHSIDNNISMARWICTALSTALAAGIVVAFLWGVPCDWAECSLDQVPAGKNWRVVHVGIGLTGSLHSIKSRKGGILNLVAVYRTQGNWSSLDDISDAEIYSSDPYSSGIAAFSLKNGSEIWRRAMFGQPTSLDCENLDVDQDGILDCIVSGKHGLMAAIDGKNGERMWYIHTHNTTSSDILDLSPPWFVPDLDNDGVTDLVTVCTFSDMPRSLVMISGRQGRILGKPLTVERCNEISQISFGKDFLLYYTCRSPNGTVTRHGTMLQDMYLQGVSRDFEARNAVKSSLIGGSFALTSPVGKLSVQTESGGIDVTVTPVDPRNPERTFRFDDDVAAYPVYAGKRCFAVKTWRNYTDYTKERLLAFSIEERGIATTNLSILHFYRAGNEPTYQSLMSAMIVIPPAYLISYSTSFAPLGTRSQLQSVIAAFNLGC